MNRVVWIAGWISLALITVSPVAQILANEFGADDERMINRDFVIPTLVALGVGLVLGIVALLRRWNPSRKALRVPAIVAVVLVTPAFGVLSWAANYAYEMPCGGG